MKKFFIKIKTHKAALVIGLSLLWFFPVFCLAGDETSGAGPVISVISWLVIGIVNFLGTNILLPLINFVIELVQYNGFLDSYAVSIGWPLVRDISNMFFVIILLVIAFSTILNISRYHYKTTLLKLVLMAILINFSKLIVGFMIDFAQVIMLTFVNAFRLVAVAAMAHSFGLANLLSITPPSGGQINRWEVFGSLMLGLVFMVISCGTMLAYVAVLLYRIISLWVFVILSPFAFFAMSFPALSKYSGEYWSKFFQQLTTGVILAFFMWLSFSILAVGFANVEMSGGAANQIGLTQSSIEGLGEVSQWDRVYIFIVAIALMLLALQYAQQAGGFAGKFAGQVSGGLTKMGKWAIDRSPYGQVRDRVKAWGKMREQERQQRIAKGGANLLNLEHNVRKGIAAPFKAAGGWWKKAVKGKAAGDLEKQAQDARDKAPSPQTDKDLQQVIQNLITALEANTNKTPEQVQQLNRLKQGKETGKFEDQDLIAIAKEARTSTYSNQPDIQRKGKDLETNITDAQKFETQAKEAILQEPKGLANIFRISRHFYEAKAEAANTLASRAREKGNDVEADKYEAIAKTNRTKGKWIERAKVGAAVAGTVFAPGVGAWIGAGALAGKGANKFYKSELLEKSHRYGQMAQGYKYQEMAKEKDEMKSWNVHQIRDIVNDISAPAFQKMAALITLFEKGVYGAKDVGSNRFQLEGLGADKRILAHYDAIVDEQFPQFGALVKRDMETGEEILPEKRMEHLITLIKAGVIDSKKVDSSALSARGGELAHAMALGLNSSQYDAMIKRSSKVRAEMGKGLKLYMAGDKEKNIKGNIDISNKSIKALNDRVDKGGDDGLAAQEELEHIDKAMQRQFLAARDKNLAPTEFFEKDGDFKKENQDYIERFLNTNGGEDAIYNINYDAYIDSSAHSDPSKSEEAKKAADEIMREKMQLNILHTTNSGTLTMAAEKASEGKPFQKRSMENLLGTLAEKAEDYQEKYLDKKTGILNDGFKILNEKEAEKVRKVLESAEKMRTASNNTSSKLSRNYNLSKFRGLEKFNPSGNYQVAATEEEEEEAEEEQQKKKSATKAAKPASLISSDIGRGDVERAKKEAVERAKEAAEAKKAKARSGGNKV